jgi:DNA-binding GntR family transcriptional regulator
MTRSQTAAGLALSEALAGEPISTMQDMIVSKLRDAIVSGALQPGQRLSERSITDKLHISKTPVREALTHLEAEGWVHIVPYRGAVVAPLSIAELEDIYVIRIALEGAAARLAAQNIDASVREKLEGIVAKMVKTKSDDTLMSLNREFHDIFYRQCKRPLLSSLISKFQDKSARYRRLLQGMPNVPTRIVRERRAVLRACERETPAAVERLVAENLRGNLERLREFLAEAKPDGET